VRLDYQSEEEEEAIVKKETGSTDNDLLKIAVRIARKMRDSPEIRRGPSVRGAIDTVAIAEKMFSSRISDLDEQEMRSLIERAAMMALSSKVEVREGSHEKLIEVIKKITGEILGEYWRARTGAEEKKSEQVEHSENF
jgi:MoxR-like ATPase